MAASDQDVTHSGDAGPGVLVREGSYGTQVFEVEPGGAEFIPLNERHGRPIQLFWTWTSPNMEFATIFVGMLAVVGSVSASGRPRSPSSWAARSAELPRESCPCAGPSTGCRRWC